MVKNVMFCLAKQQQLDPTKPFYLFQVGDDPIERLFGKLRMMGGHNSAMNYSQAIDRLGHAADLHAAFLRNPDLDQGERRLNMSRSEGVDHLTMSPCTDNIIASSCHLPTAWRNGCERAKAILKRSAVGWTDTRSFSLRASSTCFFHLESTKMAEVNTPELTPATILQCQIPPPTSSSTPNDEMADAVQDPDEEDEGDGITFEETLTDAVPELELPAAPRLYPQV